MLNQWNNNYSITFDDTLALGPYCETFLFSHILKFWLGLQTLKIYFYLVFCHAIERFLYRTQLNPFKIVVRTTLWYCRQTLELDFSFIYIYICFSDFFFFDKSWTLVHIILVSSTFIICYFLPQVVYYDLHLKFFYSVL